MWYVVTGNGAEVRGADAELNQPLGAALSRDAKRRLEGIEAWRSNRQQLG